MYRDLCSLTSAYQMGWRMKIFIKFLTLGLATFALSGGVSAEQSQGGYKPSTKRVSSYMRIYGPANPPYGFVQFCSSNPTDCRNNTSMMRRIHVTKERLSELAEINKLVNDSIEPVTDMEIYGVTEHWTVPTDKGDCEDYALLKRKLLIQRGWPESALLLTVVRDEVGDGHAVLTIRTAQGDYILDNKLDGVRIWTQTPYRYLMRQSYLNPIVWVALDAGINTRGDMQVSGSSTDKFKAW